MVRLGKYTRYKDKLLQVCKDSELAHQQGIEIQEVIKVPKEERGMRLGDAVWKLSLYNPFNRKIYFSVRNVISQVKTYGISDYQFTDSIPEILDRPYSDQLAYLFAFALFHEIGHSIQDRRGELHPILDQLDQIDREINQLRQQILRSNDVLGIIQRIDRLEDEEKSLQARHEESPDKFGLEKLLEAKRRGLLIID